MIDIIDNGTQIAVLLICAAVTLYRAAVWHSRTWTLAFFFFGVWAMGDIYWMVCLMFYGDSPQISVVSDLSWYATFIFLYLLLRRTDPPEEMGKPGLLPWLGAVFAVAMSVFFMRWGEILNNLFYAGFMSLILFASIRRLQNKSIAAKYRFLPLVSLIYCLLVYCLWTASCFWSDEVLIHPYYIFDLLITASFFFFLAAVRKAAE